MNGLKSVRLAAVAAAALASLFVAAPALADRHEGAAPQAESHARNYNVKDDKPAGDRGAAALVEAGSPCADRVFTTVFGAFHDRALYTLAPDGDFEAGAAGWQLGDGAAVVDESSTIQLGATLGARSLELADGASAVSPEICVERGFPSFRFVKRSGGRGVLRVDVLYGSGQKAKKAGRVKAGAGWRVTRRVSLAQGRFHSRRGDSASVQLRFTASRGPVRIDDVYIDPRLRR